MKKNKNYEKPKQRFSKAKFGEFIKKYFSNNKTSEVAEILGVETRKVSDYVHREKLYEKSSCWTSKDPAHRSKVCRENGKKGGRPRKNKKK